MKMISSGEKKSPLIKRLLFFVLVLLALVGISSITSEWVAKQGAENWIGVVNITGIISDSQDIVNQVKKFGQDKRIQGIVLRIDSPGGSENRPANRFSGWLCWPISGDLRRSSQNPQGW